MKKLIALVIIVATVGCPSRAWLDKVDPPYCPPDNPNCGCNSPTDPCHEWTDPCQDKMLGIPCLNPARASRDAGSDVDTDSSDTKTD